MNLTKYMLRNSRYLEDERYESVTALYRYFDGDDVLLYVGISNQPAARDKRHWQKDGEWRIFAAYMTIEAFPTRRIAEIAEQCAIADESPEFNRQVRPQNPIDAMPRHKWYLDKCGGILRGEDKRTVRVCGYEIPEGYATPFWKEPVILCDGES